MPLQEFIKTDCKVGHSEHGVVSMGVDILADFIKLPCPASGLKFGLGFQKYLTLSVPSTFLTHEFK